VTAAAANLAFFIVGLLLGVGGTLAYGGYLLRKAQKELTKTLNEGSPVKEKTKVTDADRVEYAKYKPRLDRAAQITQEQAELMAQIDQPSKNALHSKFKNGLVAEAKRLEEEKTELLRSIVADGYDPEVVVQTPEGMRRMLLTEYLASLGYDFRNLKGTATNKEAAPQAESENGEEPAVRKVGNFFVIKGGKPDTTH
jgi:hypothetical protein